MMGKYDDCKDVAVFVALGTIRTLRWRGCEHPRKTLQALLTPLTARNASVVAMFQKPLIMRKGVGRSP